MTPLEQKILAHYTLLSPDFNQQQELRRLILQVKDRERLISNAVKEGTANLLYKNLLKSDLLDTFSDRQKDKLRSLYHQTLIFNSKLIHDLKKILRQLNQKKIPVVLLQGMILLTQVYDDIGLRPMTDIDLWVLKKYYPALVDILITFGYQRDSVYPDTFKKDSTVLDLRNHLLGADRIKTRTLLLAKGQNHIYQDTQSINFEGREALCLNRYDQVLYLSLHALKHNVDQLIWLVDIKNLAADWTPSEWEALLKRARYLGLEKTIGYISFLLYHTLDFSPPQKVRQLPAGHRLHFFEKKTLKQRIKKDYLPNWAPLVFFSPGEGWRQRFSNIVETLFPRPEIMRQVFGDAPDLKVRQLYLKRIYQLFGLIRN